MADIGQNGQNLGQVVFLLSRLTANPRHLPWKPPQFDQLTQTEASHDPGSPPGTAQKYLSVDSQAALERWCWLSS